MCGVGDDPQHQEGNTGAARHSAQCHALHVHGGSPRLLSQALLGGDVRDQFDGPCDFSVAYRLGPQQSGQSDAPEPIDEDGFAIRIEHAVRHEHGAWR